MVLSPASAKQWTPLSMPILWAAFLQDYRWLMCHSCSWFFQWQVHLRYFGTLVRNQATMPQLVRSSAYSKLSTLVLTEAPLLRSPSSKKDELKYLRPIFRGCPQSCRQGSPPSVCIAWGYLYSLWLCSKEIKLLLSAGVIDVKMFIEDKSPGRLNRLCIL